MNVETTRFGRLQVDAEDVISFANGLLGLDFCQHWVLLADAQNEALGWLQSTTRADIALAVVSSRRFVADYQVRVPRSELSPLQLEAERDAKVLVIVNKNDHSLTLNLKAPLVINLKRRVGRQVVVNHDVAIQHELTAPPVALRMSA